MQINDKTHITAILMTSITTSNEILLDIAEMPTDNKKRSNVECKLILSCLENYAVNCKRIVGVVFDTTSTNSGLHNGVVVQLQTSFDHKVMQLAYRHHIFELVCGASCKIIFGST